MQPWNLRKRKRLSTSRQKRSGFEVDAHIALLKRKHAEFNWYETDFLHTILRFYSPLLTIPWSLANSFGE